MILFFEGADRTGKSNIAKALAEQHNLKVYKNDLEFNLYRQSKTELFVLLLKYAAPVEYRMAKLFDNIIFDRNYISEYVYATVFNRKTDINIIKNLDLLYCKLGAQIVFCYKTNYMAYDDEFIDIDKIDKINKVYRNYLQTINTLPVIDLDTTDEDLTSQLRDLNNKIGLR